MSLKFDPIIDKLMSNIEARFKDYRRLSPLEMEIADGIKYLRKWWGQVDEAPDNTKPVFIVTGIGNTPIPGGIGNTSEQALMGIRINGRVRNGVKVYAGTVALESETITLTYDELKSYRKDLKEVGK